MSIRHRSGVAAELVSGITIFLTAGIWSQGHAQQAPAADPALQRIEILSESQLTPRQKQDWDEYARLRPGSSAADQSWNWTIWVPGLAPIAAQMRARATSPELKISEKIYTWIAVVSARHWTNNRIWNTNSARAVSAGVKQATVSSLAAGERPTAMAVDEEIVYDLLQELWEGASVSDATYARALAEFGKPGLMEIVATMMLYDGVGAALAIARHQDSRGMPLQHLPN